MRIAGLGLVLFSLSQTAAAADTLRCGDRLVSTGSPAAEVIGVCGEPAGRHVRTVFLRRHPDLFEAIETEEWTYNFGPERFIQVLRFEGGSLVEIEPGRYGYLPPPR